jgi:muconolactone delta-isomerase
MAGIQMQFIVVFQPKEKFRTDGPPADFAQVEQAEQVQAKALYKRGDLRQIWGLKTAGKGAVGLFEAASPDELQSLIASFPMVQKDYALPSEGRWLPAHTWT